MTDELICGRRYRITLRGRAYEGGSLEGVVRAVSLPQGALGNSDGEHRVWVVGELFEWFLRPGEIRTATELRGLVDDALPVLRPNVCPAMASRRDRSGDRIEPMSAVELMLLNHRRQA